MKTLLSTTAMVLALGFPAMTLAQEAAPAAEAQAQAQSADMSGFLAERGQSDVNASDLMGHDVYARRISDETQESDDQASGSADGTHVMKMMNAAALDDMDNIGQVNEIVLSEDGQVRALVIGVGGFLGVGERDVAVTMDQVTFAYDTEDASEMYVVLNTGTEMLESAPAYDGTAMQDDASDATDRMAAKATDDTPTEQVSLTAPEMEREGYRRVSGSEISTEMLMGKTVYDVTETDVGTVTDIVLDDAGTGTEVVIDFGGFLGMGKSQVAIAYDELTFLINDDEDDIRLYVDATKEQIQSRPKHVAM
jgi:sporulation protein YlmC with PRC-barrel domain